MGDTPGEEIKDPVVEKPAEETAPTAEKPAEEKTSETEASKIPEEPSAA